MTATVYVLTPVGGRVGKSRQVPAVRVPTEEIEKPDENTNHFLLEAIEKAFHKYAGRRGMYVGMINRVGDTEANTFLYCDKTDVKLAKIVITKEEV